MLASPVYQLTVLGLAAFVLAGTASATPQMRTEAKDAPQETVIASLEAPQIKLRPAVSEPLTCAQRCDARAENVMKTCLRTVAALKSDPNWMDDALNGETCGRAAVTGADQCRKRCHTQADTPVTQLTD